MAPNSNSTHLQEPSLGSAMARFVVAQQSDRSRVRAAGQLPAAADDLHAGFSLGIPIRKTAHPAAHGARGAKPEKQELSSVVDRLSLRQSVKTGHISVIEKGLDVSFKHDLRDGVGHFLMNHNVFRSIRQILQKYTQRSS